MSVPDGWLGGWSAAHAHTLSLSQPQADSRVEWLPTVWPNVKDQMAVIMATFDVDGDGLARLHRRMRDLSEGGREGGREGGW